MEKYSDDVFNGTYFEKRVSVGGGNKQKFESGRIEMRKMKIDGERNKKFGLKYLPVDV